VDRSRRRHLLRQLGLLLRRVRQELVQRRVEEADRRRIALQRAEDAGEVLALIRQQLGQRAFPLLERLGEDHLAHRVDAVALEEHVLGAAEADADGAERDRVLVCSGVSALVRTLMRVAVGTTSSAAGSS
jgi:DNA-binding MarR family transcriptional regulator